MKDTFSVYPSGKHNSWFLASMVSCLWKIFLAPAMCEITGQPTYLSSQSSQGTLTCRVADLVKHLHW